MVAADGSTRENPARPPDPGLFGAPLVQTSPLGSGIGLVQTATSAPTFLRPREVAERLAVCTATVYTLIERGELQAVRVGSSLRVSVDVLLGYLARAPARQLKQGSATAEPSAAGSRRIHAAGAVRSTSRPCRR
jgi:excisionase family DNA binding protein